MNTNLDDSETTAKFLADNDIANASRLVELASRIESSGICICLHPQGIHRQCPRDTKLIILFHPYKQI
ncbi:MAG: hypothetical protein MR924_04850 [Prevotella sp.]|nr:hypothetical protein [Prevotella sp.]